MLSLSVTLFFCLISLLLSFPRFSYQLVSLITNDQVSPSSLVTLQSKSFWQHWEVSYDYILWDFFFFLISWDGTDGHFFNMPDQLDFTKWYPPSQSQSSEMGVFTCDTWNIFFSFSFWCGYLCRLFSSHCLSYHILESVVFSIQVGRILQTSVYSFWPWCMNYIMVKRLLDQSNKVSFPFRWVSHLLDYTAFFPPFLTFSHPQWGI